LQFVVNRNSEHSIIAKMAVMGGAGKHNTFSIFVWLPMNQ
jgi:hypothetical protein